MKKMLVTRVLFGLLFLSLPFIQYSDYSNTLKAEKEAKAMQEKLKEDEKENSEEEDIIVPVAFSKADTKYNSLSLGSIEEVIQSMESAYGVDYTSTMSKQRVFDKTVNSRISLYTSSDDRVEIGVMDDGSILYVSVKEQPELQKFVKKFMNGKDNNTGYFYMEDTTSFIIKK